MATSTQQQNPAALDLDRLSAFKSEVEGLHGALREPGLAIGIVRGGKLAWFRGFGFADIETKTAVTRDTPFHLASLTKPFASTIILGLVEQGLVDLDRPVIEYGVELSHPSLEIDRPRVVTTRHLLSHTAQGTPGENYRYNGNVFGRLSDLVEKVTDRTFFELAHEKIIAPLALENTGNRLDATRVPLASPYVLEGGELSPGSYAQFYSAAAGMIGSVADLATYSQALDENKFLKAQTQRAIFTPTTSNSGEALPYGLGWFVEDFEGNRLLWHYGHWQSASSLIIKIPGKDLTLIALSNTDHLSRGFNLGAGSVLASPLALSFLRTHLLPKRSGDEGFEFDWGLQWEQLASAMKDATGALKSFLKREAWAQIALASSMGDSEAATRLIYAYSKGTECGPLVELERHPVISRLDGVGANADLTRTFTLDEETTIRVVAVGEGGATGFVDYAWIENAASGETAWSMSAENTEHAGGASINRLFQGNVKLAAGAYKLRYKSDSGHDRSRWMLQPPDGAYWGVTLFEE